MYCGYLSTFGPSSCYSGFHRFYFGAPQNLGEMDGRESLNPSLNVIVHYESLWAELNSRRVSRLQVILMWLLVSIAIVLPLILPGR